MNGNELNIDVDSSTSNLSFDINSWFQEESQEESYNIANTAVVKEIKTPTKNAQKEWTLICYIAADNDLGPFAIRNIKQMANIGSTPSINILVHLDTKTINKKKVTRRFYVAKNKLIQVNAHDPVTQKMDSGDPQTVISCFKWATKDFPANKYAFFLWDHATGPLDPMTGRIFNASELFTYNATTNKLDLDRNIGFLEYISIIDSLSKVEQRGICWDDTTGNYLTNQKLDFALKTICKECLNGKKIDLLGFDACLMGSLEIAAMVKKYAHLMVGSQEVVLGAGYHYQKVLEPFLRKSLTPYDFATHIVQTYAEVYNAITDDYTQSAINLDSIGPLEKNLDVVARLLIESINKQHGHSVKKAIQKSRYKKTCTHFDEPSYIDLHHFYCNLLSHIHEFKLQNRQDEQRIKNGLKIVLEQGKRLIKDIVFINIVGSNLNKASGLSIYFPEKRIHSSYKKTIFASTTQWLNFLAVYLFSS